MTVCILRLEHITFESEAKRFLRSEMYPSTALKHNWRAQRPEGVLDW